MDKPKSIKNVGIIIVVVSILILFSNISGALVELLMRDEFSSDTTENSNNIIELIFNNYLLMCLFMLIIGILYLIGGVLMIKYKKLGRDIVFYNSILMVVLIWVLMIGMALAVPSENFFWIFKIGAIINAILWCTPLYFLLKYLGKEKIKAHFK